MSRLIFYALSLGLMFGVGFWVGRVTDVLPEINKQTDSVEIKEKILKDIQKRLHLSYYSELIKTPSVAVEAVGLDSIALPEAGSVSKPILDKDKIAQALAKVLGSETPDSVKKVIRETLPSNTGSAFAIQVGSFLDRKQAEELVKRLRSKGHLVKLVQAENSEKEKIYRVRIHGFQTREEAEAYQHQHGIEGITVAQ